MGREGGADWEGREGGSSELPFRDVEERGGKSLLIR